MTLQLPHVRARRGGVYIAVLGTAMIVSMIGMCALHLARLELRAARCRQQQAQTRSLAQTGIEFALGRIDLDSNWRSSYTNGQVQSYVSLGSEQFSFKLEDPADGDLANDATQPVQISGIGKVKDAVFVYTATYAETSDGFALVPGSWRQSSLSP